MDSVLKSDESICEYDCFTNKNKQSKTDNLLRNFFIINKKADLKQTGSKI